MKAKLPTVKDLSALIRAIKPEISDKYRESPDDLPGIGITIGWNPETGDWSYQTGDNSYTGGAYGFPVWAVDRIHRRSDSREMARDLRAQLEEADYHSYMGE